MFNIIELIKGVVTPELVSGMSQVTGESPAATSAALDRIGPAVGAGLISRGSTSRGAAELLSLSEKVGLSTDPSDLRQLLSNPETAGSWAQRGLSLVSGLFGHRASGFGDAVASQAGITGRSSSMLMGLLAPIGLSLLGQNARASGLGAEGLAGLLASQKDRLASLLPAGLGSMLGLVDTRERVEPVQPVRAASEVESIDEVRSHPEDRPVARPAGTRGRWWPVALGAGLAGLLMLVLPRIGKRAERTEVEPPAGPAVSADRDRREAPGAEQMPRVKRQLPDGAQVELSQGGAADRLYRLLQRGHIATTELLPSSFRSGSSQLSRAGESTVDEIARVLKGFPEAAITVAGGTGRTDAGGDTADPRDSRWLAGERARAIRRELAAEGVDPGRLAVSRLVASGAGATLEVRRY